MYYRNYSVKKFAKGGITTDVFQMSKKISKKDFDNGMSFEDGNKKISIQKKTNVYNVKYYEKNDKNKFEIVSSYSSPYYEDVIYDINTFKFAKGGKMNEKRR